MVGELLAPRTAAVSRAADAMAQAASAIHLAHPSAHLGGRPTPSEYPKVSLPVLLLHSPGGRSSGPDLIFKAAQAAPPVQNRPT